MRNYGYSIFCADLETFVDKSSYCQERECKATTYYAIACQRVSVYWTYKTDWVSMKYTPTNDAVGNLQLFGDMSTWFNWLRNVKRWGTDLIVYFHNGQKFDFWFILDYCKKNFVFSLDVFDNSMKDECSIAHEGQNIWCYDTTAGWMNFQVWLWDSTTRQHVKIEFRDSLKIMTGSIYSWSKDLLGKTFKEDLLKDRWAWHCSKHGERNVALQYDLIDLDKKDLDIYYVDNKKGTTLFCKDGTSYDLNNVKAWPVMIKERVGNDVLIMVYVIKYLLIHHMMNIEGSTKIAVSTGQLSIRRWVHERLKDEMFKNKVTKNHKVDDETLWFETYGCSQKERDEEAFNLTPFIRGGICTLNPDYIGKIVKGSFISLDVNSEYPFIALGDLPFGVGEIAHEIPTDPNKYYFVEFKFKKLSQVLRNATPVIPVTWAPLERRDEFGDVHYVYELKDGIGYVGMNEWKVFMNKKWFHISGLQVLNVHIYDKRAWLRSYMETYSQQKINATSKAQRMNAKTLLNAITGKLDQRPWRQVSVNPSELIELGVDKQTIYDTIHSQGDMNDKVLERFDWAIEHKQSICYYTYQPASFAYVPGYCAITSGGRAWLMSHMFELCEHFKDVICLYNDTDSIKFKVYDLPQVMKYLQEHEWLHDTQLGKFKEEFHDEVKQMKILCPKKYLSCDKDGYIIKSKGAYSGIKWKEVVALAYPECKDWSLHDERWESAKVHQNLITPTTKFNITRTKKVNGGIIIVDVQLQLNQIHVKE